jgi:hypothetical protein
MNIGNESIKAHIDTPNLCECRIFVYDIVSIYRRYQITSLQHFCMTVLASYRSRLFLDGVQ